MRILLPYLIFLLKIGITDPELFNTFPNLIIRISKSENCCLKFILGFSQPFFRPIII